LPPTTRCFPPYSQRERARERSEARQVDKGHGRFEVRTLTSTIALNDHVQWPGVGQVFRVVSETTRRGQQTRDVRYYVTSLPPSRFDAKRLLAIVRGHWGAIENGLHWMRDVVFREDRSTISTGHAPQNLAALRNAALACLRADETGTVASKVRRFARKSERLFTMLGLL
jgi:predicted transposase YbfD/YdcC